MLRREGLISEALVRSILNWRHRGFSVQNAVRVRSHAAAARKKLAQYMLRAPFTLEKISYDSDTGMVPYRSRLHKALKRNFQIMPGAEWLALLCRHIPDRFEHLVRYAGWYSNRARGKRRQAGVDTAAVVTREPDGRESSCVRSTWTRLIHKVYEVDPLECPRCKGPMRVIALIEDPSAIKKILVRLGVWAPQQRPPTVLAPSGVRRPSAPDNVLTDHPVPDIA